MMTKLDRATREMLMTAEEALTWARGLKRWPSRRFRVEGSPAGSSRLLGKKTAESTQARYGGRIVELIPLPSTIGEPRKTVNTSRAEGLPICPKCDAAPGHPCREAGPDGARGDTRPPHRVRLQTQPLLDERMGTHYDAIPHGNNSCTDPARCDCECPGCMASYELAGRPGPAKGAAPPPKKKRAKRAPEPGTAEVSQ